MSRPSLSPPPPLRRTSSGRGLLWAGCGVVALAVGAVAWDVTSQLNRWGCGPWLTGQVVSHVSQVPEAGSGWRDFLRAHASDSTGWDTWVASLPVERVPVLAVEAELWQESPGLASSLAARWAREDGAEMARSALARAGTDLGAALASVVAGRWETPLAADVIQWAAEWPEPVRRAALVTQVTERYVERDPSNVLAAVAGLPAAPGRTALLEFAVTRWAAVDPAAAAEGVALLPTGADRDAAKAALAAALRPRDLASLRDATRAMP